MAKATKKRVVTAKKTAARATGTVKRLPASSGVVRIMAVKEAQELAAEEVAAKGSPTAVATKPQSIAKTKGAAPTAKIATDGVAQIVVAPTPKRVIPTVASPAKVPAKAPAQAAVQRAAQAVKTGKASVRSAAQPMTPRHIQIRAENFRYVVKDLRLIAGIAVAMIVVLVVLRIILSAKGIA
jgi:hypothetical protein